MKRTRITVEEKLTYRHDVIVEHDMDDKQFDQMLDRVERELRYGDGFDELVASLKTQGLKIVKVIENDLSSPMDAEVEIYEIGDEDDDM